MDNLKHYGIPGMKWGVRRATGSNGLVVKTSNIKSKKGSISPEDTSRINKSVKIGSLIGGAPGGIIAGGLTSRKIRKEKEVQIANVLKTPIEKINRKSLKDAAKVARDHSYVKVKLKAGNKWVKVNPGTIPPSTDKSKTSKTSKASKTALYANIKKVDRERTRLSKQYDNARTKEERDRILDKVSKLDDEFFKSTYR